MGVGDEMTIMGDGWGWYWVWAWGWYGNLHRCGVLGGSVSKGI